MGKIFNIAGPCNPARHYMLTAIPDLGGDRDAKLSHEDIDWSGRAVHLFRC